MSSLRIAGILLVATGVLVIAVGRFTYTEDTHDVDIGPLEIEVEEKETVNIPLWAGIAAVAGGAAMIAIDRKGRKSNT